MSVWLDDREKARRRVRDMLFYYVQSLMTEASMLKTQTLRLSTKFVSLSKHITRNQTFEVMNDMKQLTDDQLVEMYRDGKDAAFDALLARHKDRLYSYIFYSVHQADTADDIFQETFVRAIVTIRQGGYTSNGKFYSWLARIAHNLVIDSFRDQQSDNALQSEELMHELYGTGSVVGSSVEREQEAERCVSDVKQLIDLLPEAQQEVVRMRLYENMSFKDIAEQKSISINTALGRMHYAIINLRRMAGERGVTAYTL